MGFRESSNPCDSNEETAALSTYAACLLLSLALPNQPAGAGGERPLSNEQAAELERKFFVHPKQLTTDGQCGEGYFSPDGTKVIFQSIRGNHPFYQIYIKDLAGGEERLVSTGFGRTTCAYFHPTKPKIIYASSHLDPERDAVVRDELRKLEEQKKNPQRRRGYEWNFDPYMDIFEADLDGKNLVRLTHAKGYDAEGSYSPDGSKIVFCSYRRGNGNIYVMDADGGNVVQITNFPQPYYAGGPFFSPDGKQIVFRAEVDKKDYLQLFVINADGTGQKQLTANDAVNWGPYWHPDGRHLIFATSLHGHYNYELYWLEIASGKLQRVTHTMGADVLPVFDAAGKRLLWTSKRGKDHTGQLASELWIADWILAK